MPAEAAGPRIVQIELQDVVDKSQGFRLQQMVIEEDLKRYLGDPPYSVRAIIEEAHHSAMVLMFPLVTGREAPNRSVEYELGKGPKSLEVMQWKVGNMLVFMKGKSNDLVVSKFDDAGKRLLQVVLSVTNWNDRFS